MLIHRIALGSVLSFGGDAQELALLRTARIPATEDTRNA